MIGYRLIRSDEYAELRGHRTTVMDLLKQLGDLREKLGVKTAMVDLLTMRVNVLEANEAQMKHQVAGAPVAFAQLGKGSPVVNARLGAGVDLFEDVGDEEAQRLKDLGMLHEDAFDVPLPPAGKDLVEQVGG